MFTKWGFKFEKHFVLDQLHNNRAGIIAHPQVTKNAFMVDYKLIISKGQTVYYKKVKIVQSGSTKNQSECENKIYGWIVTIIRFGTEEIFWLITSDLVKMYKWRSKNRWWSMVNGQK